MRIVRFWLPEKGIRMGVVRDDMVVDLTNLNPKIFRSFQSMVREASSRKIGLEKLILDSIEENDGDGYGYDELDRPPKANGPYLMMPFRPPEVWGAGVTYMRSTEAREVETKAKGVYARVYEAPRPEIFFKATARRCVGPNEPIYIRSDSRWNAPEPELALIMGKDSEILGYTIGNDVSSRDIEGENPLYLPQAKIYKGCCALGPSIATAEGIGDPRNLEVACRIFRKGVLVFEGKTSTSRLKRSFDELVDYLCRDNPLPFGTVFLTGTGIVPPDDFSLEANDLVEITIQGIGCLRNPVRRARPRKVQNRRFESSLL
ncbi:MAG: fumarylacetoacetate hydrolase family protein [Candidatus Bathyarchaeia archaeon]